MMIQVGSARVWRIAIMATAVVSVAFRVLGADPSSMLLGARVTQKRGIVCITDDFVVRGADGGSAAVHGWLLDKETAVGVVEKIEKGGFAVVRFDNTTGWSRYEFEPEKKVYYDYWNREFFVVVRNKTANFRPDENGLLLSGENDTSELNVPIRVRLPVACISFPPPKLGDRVVRGPDWNKGSADGQPGLEGTIIRRSPDDLIARGRDGYVTVEWDATRRKGRYRWDYLRKFDVIPVKEPEPAAITSDPAAPSDLGTAGEKIGQAASEN